MKKDRKTKNELIEELESVRRKVKKLETLLKKRKHTEQDITERKHAEDTLHESEEKFRLLYTSMDQGVALHEIITDADGKPVDGVYVDINESYTRLLGITREAIGKRIREVVPLIEQYWIDVFGKVALTGEPAYYENYFETTGRYYSTHAYSPKKNQFAVLVTDITERKRSEEQLSNSEEKYRGIFENVQDAYYESSIDGTLLEVSPSIENLTRGQYHRDELIGKSMYDFYSDPGERQAFLVALQARGPVTDFEITLKNRDGSQVPCSVSAKIEFDAQGTPVKIIGSIRDITERKRAEEEMMNLSKFPAENPFPILRLKPDGIILYANEASQALLWEWGCIVGDCAPKLWCDLAKETFAGPSRKTIDVRCGQLVYSFTLVPISGAGYVNLYGADITERRRGEVQLRRLNRVYSVLSNINEAIVRIHDLQRLFQEACRIAVEEGKFEMAWVGLVNTETQKVDVAASCGNTQGFLENINIDMRDGLGSAGPTGRAIKTGRHVLSNDIEMDDSIGPWREAAMRYGYRSSASFPLKVLGTTRGAFILYSNEVDFFDENEAKLFDELAMDVSFAIEFVQEESERKRAEAELITANKELAFQNEEKEKRAEELIIANKELAFQNEEKEKRAAELIVANKELLFQNEERKRAEETKKNLEGQLQQAQKLESIGTLASGIAHDFNNMLGIILGHSTLLERLRENPQMYAESVAAITKATQRGAGLVKQLMLFARKTEPLLESVKVNNIIGELTKLLQETFPKTITISTSLQQDLPTIVADASQIHQVLLNLFVNARDAMPSSGTLSISTRTIEGKSVSSRFSKATARQYVQIEVTDTGIGMDESTRQRIFEPFFTTKAPGKGTGLGLAVVFGIVEHHSGFIDARSAPGEGTSFAVYLPITERAVEELQVARKSPEEMPGGTETILVIEDEEMLRELVKASLVSKGYTVLTAEDGMQGIEMYQSHQKKIAVVLSDVGLPLLSGQDVFRKIREINPKAKVILASGFIDSETKSEMFKTGLNNFIQKPYLPDEVLQAIREVIDMHQE